MINLKLSNGLYFDEFIAGCLAESTIFIQISIIIRIATYRAHKIYKGQILI